jgi:hypothetical protein
MHVLRQLRQRGNTHTQYLVVYDIILVVILIKLYIIIITHR